MGFANPCIDSFALSLSAFVAILATKTQRREVIRLSLSAMAELEAEKEWRVKSEKWRLEAGEMEITNYQLPTSILLVFFRRRRYSLCNCNSSAFQAVSGCCVFARRSMTCGYECFCLSGNDEFVN